MKNLINKIWKFSLLVPIIFSLQINEVKGFSGKENPKNPRQVLVIDPGHDETYPGTGHPDEKFLNLDVSKLIRKKINSNYSIFLTREDSLGINKKRIDYNGDKRVDLIDELISRVEYAKSKNPDYVISIHFNSNKDTSKIGAQIFYPAIFSEESKKNGKIDFCAEKEDCWNYSKKSYELAEDMKNYLEANGIEAELIGADYKILVGNQNKDSKQVKYPSKNAILLELGYLSNEKERLFIKSKEGKEKYSQLVADFFNMLSPKKLKAKEIRINYTVNKSIKF